MSNIAVGTVITAVDKSVDATGCQGKEGYQGRKRFLKYTLWRRSERAHQRILEQNDITLAELVNNQEVLIMADRQNNDSRCIDKRSSTRSYRR